MARIVYGVSGEGSGHSSRARVMAGYLQERGHEVKIVSYDRGYRNLQDDFDVFESTGLHIASIDNKVDYFKTLLENVRRLEKGQKVLKKVKEEIFNTFQPHCVLTDFEPMTAYLAKHFDLPLISIDNQHRMRYMHYPCPPGHSKEKYLTENIIRAMVPSPDVSLVTSFYFGRVKNNRTFIYPPILRKEVLDLQAARGSDILVYLTSGYDSLLQQLHGFKRERFLVYGYDRNEQDGNIIFKSFSKNGFLQDLANAKAVIATAGFTLMTESLYLKKPYLAMPMSGQFEQELNAYLLEKLGYGVNMKKMKHQIMAGFLYDIPECEEKLQDYHHSGNEAIQQKLAELVADDATLAMKYHHDKHA